MNIFNTALLLALLSFSLINNSLAQIPKSDSLLNVLSKLEEDSVKVNAYLDLGLELMSSDANQSIAYLDDAIKLASKINYKKGLAKAYNIKGRSLAQQGNLQQAMLVFDQSLNEFKEIKDKTGEANILSNLGSIYFMSGNSSKALELHFESLKISEELDNKLRIGTSLNNIGTVYQKNNTTINEALTFFKRALKVFHDIDLKLGMATASMNIGEIYFLESKYDSAISYHQLALEIVDGTVDAAFPLTQLGEINAALGNFQKSFGFHRRALDIAEKLDAKFELTQALIGLAKTQRKQQEYGGAINTLERAKLLAIEVDAKNELMEAYINLAEIQALVGDYKSAYENEINVKSVKEEIAKSSTEQMVQQLQFEFALDQKEGEIELLQKDTELKNAAVFNQRVIIFASLGGLVMFVAISISLFRNNLSKQKANHLLQVQKAEIHAQREKVESAYDQLKSAQAQLIQSEKMASLGELTAGIAHEIKNPLNFVNNFSEVCSELIEELQDELNRGDKKVAIELADDIKTNLGKINFHGKRADSIVQGMLEHSKRASGQKQETNINGLVDEFLRMTYQSYLAKDKDFHVEIETNLDSNLPKISIIPQDIGKVLLNLYSNAFYVCSERNRGKGDEIGKRGKGIDIGDIAISNPNITIPYTPTVTVTTNSLAGGKGIEISIKDNGSGIPDSIKDKIFQPFFTTKPTGQGTGLGLSLSYDIVKAHGGEIKVESKVGEGTAFTIILPTG